MLIKAIRLENFMAFKDTGWIELRPINLLFGRNSSGKSVIIRALRLLKQSLYSNGTRFASKNKVLVLSAEGKMNLGLFRQVVHQQQAGGSITFSFRSSLNTSLSERLFRAIPNHFTLDSQGNIKNKEVEMDYRLSFAEDSSLTDPDSRRQAELIEIALAYSTQDSEESPNDIFTAEKIQGEWLLRGGELLPLGTDEEVHWSNTSLDCPIGFLPELKFLKDASPPASHELQLIHQLLTTLRENITDFLAHIEYLNPLRPEPSRIYFMDESFSERLEMRGLSAWLEFLRDKVTPDKVTEIARWLEELGLGQKVTIETLKHDGEVVGSSVNINENQKSETPINLSHLGFGASQVLPIIVQSVLAKEGSLVIIEQPELHLHPRAQAQLADLFISMARRGVYFLIETHSEHLLLRLRRRIAETSNRNHLKSNSSISFLRQDDLAIYFLHRMDKISSCEKINISDYGDFLNIPQGFGDFFSDDLIETGKLAQERLSAGLTWRKVNHDSRN